MEMDEITKSENLEKILFNEKTSGWEKTTEED